MPDEADRHRPGDKLRLCRRRRRHPVRRNVELGPLDDGLRVIRKALKAEDWVILRGHAARAGRPEDRAEARGHSPSRRCRARRAGAPGGQAVARAENRTCAFSHFFIDRPIFASVISLVILIVGAIAYLGAAASPSSPRSCRRRSPSRPPIRAPTPQTVADTVAAVIEQEVNGVEGMIYMSSQSTNDGDMSLTVTFEHRHRHRQGAGAGAEPRRRRRAAPARGGAPQRHHVRKSSPDLLLVVHLVSPDKTYDQVYISNYALLNVQRRAGARSTASATSRCSARANTRCASGSTPSASPLRGMTADEVVGALRAQNVQVAGGALGQPPQPNMGAFQMSLQLKGRLLQPSEFENIVLKTGADGRRRAPQGRRPRRARRAELHDLRLSGRLPGHRDRRSPSSPARTPSTRRTPSRRRWSGCRSASPRASSTASSTTRRSSSRLDRRALQDHPRGGRSSSSSSCCCSCRRGARRSSRSSPSRSR